MHLTVFSLPVILSYFTGNLAIKSIALNNTGNLTITSMLLTIRMIITSIFFILFFHFLSFRILHYMQTLTEIFLLCILIVFDLLIFLHNVVKSLIFNYNWHCCHICATSALSALNSVLSIIFLCLRTRFKISSILFALFIVA